MTLSVRTLLIGLGAAAVVIAGAVLIWLVVDKAGQIDDLNSAARTRHTPSRWHSTTPPVRRT